MPGAKYVAYADMGNGEYSQLSWTETALWGDTDGTGVCDVTDILCVAGDGFSGQYTPECALEDADIAPCIPDGLVELSDVIFALKAYAQENYFGYCYPRPCGEPLLGGEGSMGGGFFPPPQFDNMITFTATPASIPAGQAVTVRAFLFGPPDLRGYQVGVDAAGGTSGTLTLSSLSVETARTDFVFYELDSVTPTNLAERRLAGALYTGGVEVGETTLYLGRFVFTASPDALGTFTFTARVTDTKLVDSADQQLEWESIPKNIAVTAP